MKVHELIGSMPREQSGPSLTETKVGEAGRAVIAEALSKPHKSAIDDGARKMRLKEFLQLLKRVETL